MEGKRILTVVGVLVIVVTALVTACGGPSTVSVSEPTATVGATDGGESPPVGETPQESAGEQPTEASAPSGEQFPENLVLLPDATDIDINLTTGQYVYIVPGLVEDIANSLLTQLKAKGWEELGQPTIMGHLATLNFQMGNARLTVSMQDNERTETTRVRMLLIE